MPSPAKAPRTAVVVCRVSTQKQAEGETIAGQIERCRRLVERYGVRLIKYGNGWKPVGASKAIIPANTGWIIDDGISGSLLDGRAFGQFIGDVRARKVKVDHVIVFNLARISRLDKSSGDMERMIRSHEHNALIKAVFIGAHVTVLDEEGENDPKTTIYDLKTAVSIGQYNEIQKNTTNGKIERARKGQWPKGGRPPFGYRKVLVNGVDRKDGFKLEPHPDEARHVRTILGWYVEAGGVYTYKDEKGREHTSEKGGLTYAARKATEAGFPPPFAGFKRKDKSTWFASSVKSLVDSAKMYSLGEQTLSFGGEPHTVKFKPIIDGKLYEAVKRRAGTRTLKHRAEFLSTGFVDCSCGAHVHARSSYAHRRHYIRCANSCGVGGIYEDKFSAILWTAAFRRLLAIRQHERTNGHDADNGETALKAARAKIEAATADVAKLVDLYLTAGLDKDVFRQRNDALNERKAAAQAEVDAIVREREARAQKKATLDNLEARVGKLLDEIEGKPQPMLVRKREILGEVLAGGRVTVSWPKSKPQVATLTFPTHGDLPAFTVRTDAPVTELLGGITVEDAADREELLRTAPYAAADHVKIGDVLLDVRFVKDDRRWYGLLTPSGVFIPLVPSKPVADAKPARRKGRSKARPVVDSST